jgi:plasmid maintenance system antidote protein VapI
MPRKASERIRQLRIVVRYFLDHGLMREGSQAFLARRFDVTRQRVNQIVAEERQRRLATVE